MTITRRNALLTGAAAAAALPLMPRAAFAASDVDIAIVGGGLSGVYAALRLATSKPNQSLRLFEMSDRLGGRLRSIAFPQAPGLIGEAGGARFLDSHRHVTGLARALDLVVRPTPLNLPQDRLNLKTRNIPIALAGAGADALPYEMPAAHQDLSAWSLRKALAAIAPETAGLTPAQWRAKRLSIGVKGKPLSAWNAGALLADALSPGERDFLRDTARLDDAALEGNALAQELHKQASTTFGVPAPAPVAAAFQDWSVDPYGGGLAAWNTGADPLAASDAMLQPLKGRALYVVGDTWSPRQNWAEGALEQTEAMLQKHFGLNVPGWIAS
jgi:monoamine oxidase